MQEITLSLPFDQHIFSLQQKLRWQIFIRKKYSSYLYFRGAMGVVLLFFLIDLLSGNETPYNATFFGVTLFLLVYNIVSPWVTVFKSKRKFFQAGEKLVSRYKDKAFVNTYKLDEEGISYEDDERYNRMKWSLFYPF